MVMSGRAVRCLAALSLLAAGGRGGAAEFFADSAAAVAAVMERAQPGDTVVLRNGTWRDQHVVFAGEGTPAAPIILRAETPGQVVLTGASRLSIGGSHLVVNGLHFKGGALTSGSVIEFRAGSERPARHCLLTQTAIEDYNPPDPETRYFWVSLYGSDNRVEHCAFQGQTHSGVTLCVVPEPNAPARHVIRRTYFGPRPLGRGNGFETIRIGTSGVSMQEAACSVEENLFERCDGEIEIVSNKTCGNRYRHNTFLECSGCLTLRHGNGCLVEGNTFLGGGVRGAGGLRIIGEDHVVVNNLFTGTKGRAGGAVSLQAGIVDSPLAGYFQVKNTVIAFNTFVDNPGPLFDLAAGHGSRGCVLLPESTLIANNLLVGGPEAAPMLVDRPATPGIRWEGNLAAGGTLGREIATGVTTVPDAGLERGADGLWRVAPASPARGAAVLGDALRDACARQGITLPERADVGAVRFGTEGTPWKPLARADVGPRWMSASGAGTTP